MHTNWKEKVKLFLFIDVMIIYIKRPKNLQKSTQLKKKVKESPKPTQGKVSNFARFNVNIKK